MKKMTIEFFRLLVQTILVTIALAGTAIAGWDNLHSEYLTKIDFRILSIQDRIHFHEFRVKELSSGTETPEKRQQKAIHETTVEELKMQLKFLQRGSDK